MQMETFTHDAYIEEYTENEEDKDIFQRLQGQVHEEKVANKANYHLQDGFLYKMDKLYVTKGE
jgi:hypothetical protein